MLEAKQLANIGFDHVLSKLEPWSPFGEEKKRRLAPYAPSEREALLAEFRNISALAEAFSRDPAAFGPLARALMQLKDIRRSLKRSRETALSDIELFEVKRFLMLAEALEAAYSALPFADKLEGINIFALPEALDILDPDGMRAQTFRLPDGASPRLAEIRKRRKAVDLALRALPAAAENGAERDRLSAERTNLAAMEENEELRLRGEMTRAFSAHAESAEELIESIGRLDHAAAKARLMLALGGTVPEILPENGEKRIVFKAMVNPETAAVLGEKGRRFTPVSIELGPGSTVITGANMGGKSVAVKTLALNAFLAVCGMPVFCSFAALPLLPEIHLLSEDMEDSRGGLSSFGGEMVRFNGILASAEKEKGSLVLLDEFARGTNPHEGSALVRGAVRYFNETGDTYALITTHFDDVACLAKVHYQVMGLRNADEAALTAALSSPEAGSAPQEMLARFMDYGLFKAGSEVNPPRDALKICRALRIREDFMNKVTE